MRSLLALTVTLATAVAVAKPPSLEPGAPPLAEQRYQVGRELYAKDDIAGAAREFGTALALFPTSAKLAYNLARCEERLGRLGPAIEHYERYLELSPKAEDAESVRTLVGVLRAQHGAPAAPPAAATQKPAAPAVPAPKPAEPAPKPPTETPSPTPAAPPERPIRHWGVTLGGSAGGSFTADLPLSTGVVVYDEDLEQNIMLLVMWDTPLWRGLRLGAEVGGHAMKVAARKDDKDAADLSVAHLGLRIRYVFEFGDWTVFPAVAVGPAFVTLTADKLDGQGTGAHVAGRLSVGYDLGAVDLVATLSVETDTIATFDLDVEGGSGVPDGVKVSVEAEDTEITRGALSLGVWF